MRTLALLAVLVAACVAGWLVLAARDAGPSGRGRARGASAEDSSAAPRGDVSAPLEAAAGPPDGAPLAVERGDAPSTPPRAALAPGDEVAPVGADLPPTSRGRLVDALTLEPIPDALVVTGRQNATTDADGRFDTGVALDALGGVLVLNVAPGGRKHEVARERWTRLVAGWRVPIEIGPTYRLHVSGAPDDSKGWEARLVNGDETAKWLEVRGSKPQYLRYDAPIAERDGVEPRVEVRSLDGLVEGIVHGVGLRGVHELDVHCSARAVVRGRVLDELGRPIDSAPVWAVQLAAGSAESLSTRSDANGSYQLQPKEPGRMLLVLSALGSTAVRRLELEVPTGLTEAPDVVFARVGSASIRGSLQAPMASDLSFRVARVRLRALEGDGYEEERAVTIAALDGIPSTGSFEFAGLSPGRYELAVLSDGTGDWQPARLEVSAPAERVVFTRANAPIAAYRFDAIGARGGAPVGALRVELRPDSGDVVYRQLAPGATFDLVAGARFAWRVAASGYLPREGTERDFVPDGDARFAARIELRPGFGARVVVKPWGSDLLPQVLAVSTRGATAMRAAFIGGGRIAGAAILADGVVVGTTDERGIADIELAARPRSLAAALSGWRAVDGGFDISPSATGEYELVLVRE